MGFSYALKSPSQGHLVYFSNGALQVARSRFPNFLVLN